jgi:hypothetical protein
LTLNWKGVSCIGGGWDTYVGLTPFGLDVVKNCFKKGIVVDLSHSSENVQNEVISLAQSFNVSPIFSIDSFILETFTISFPQETAICTSLIYCFM